MLKIILQSRRSIPPFNEPARDLRIQNKPLWLAHRDVLAPYTNREVELPPDTRLPQVREPCIVYRDNLHFDSEYIRAFLEEAQKRKRPSRAAFTIQDPGLPRALPAPVAFLYAGRRPVPGRSMVLPQRPRARL